MVSSIWEQHFSQRITAIHGLPELTIAIESRISKK